MMLNFKGVDYKTEWVSAIYLLRFPMIVINR